MRKEPLEGFLREKMGIKLREIVLNPVRQLRKSLKVEKEKWWLKPWEKGEKSSSIIWGVYQDKRVLGGCFGVTFCGEYNNFKV